MSELRPIGWYASRIAPHLPKEAFKPAPARLWGGLAYLTITAAGIIAVATLDLHPLGYVALAFIIGNAMAGMGFLAHEILHGTVVKTAWLRDLLGGIGFTPFLLGPKLWRKWHNMEHHAHTQDDDLDPDAWATMEALFQRPGLRALYHLPPWFRSLCTFIAYTFFFSVHSQLMLKKFYKHFKPSEKRAVLLQLFAPIALWVALFAWVGPYKFLFAFVIPLMICNFLVISYISTNHQLNPMTNDVNDPLVNSLTVTVPRWVDFLHFNFSYHTEHHLFPGVNPRWGPLIQEHTRRLFPDKYNVMPMSKAMLALWKTPRIYKDSTTLVDPHRGLAYGSLGFGLDPNEIKARPAGTPTQSFSISMMEESPSQGDD